MESLVSPELRAKPAQRGTRVVQRSALAALLLSACAVSNERPSDSAGTSAATGGTGGTGAASPDAVAVHDGADTDSDAAIGSGDAGMQALVDAGPSCGSRLARRPHQACLVDAWSDEDAGLDEYYRLRWSELTSTIEAIEPRVRCAGIGSRHDVPGDGYGVRVVDQGQGLSLGLVLPWQAPLFDVGDVLNVVYQRDSPPAFSEGFGPGGVATVRDAEGKLLYWIVESFYGFEFLKTPPELTIEDGQPACTYPAIQCDEIVLAGIRVDAGHGAVDVPFGATQQVGDYVILLGDNERHTKPATCYHEGHHVTIVAVRGSLEALEAQP